MRPVHIFPPRFKLARDPKYNQKPFPAKLKIKFLLFQRCKESKELIKHLNRKEQSSDVLMVILLHNVINNIAKVLFIVNQVSEKSMFQNIAYYLLHLWCKIYCFSNNFLFYSVIGAKCLADLLSPRHESQQINTIDLFFLFIYRITDRRKQFVFLI